MTKETKLSKLREIEIRFFQKSVGKVETIENLLELLINDLAEEIIADQNAPENRKG